MQATADRANTIMRRLAEQGYRQTSTRAAIAEAIAARTAQFTARQLLEELEPRGIGRATVFRALDLLVQVGLLERLHGEVNCNSYTYCATEHHHHLICTACGLVTSVVAGAVEREVRRLANAVHFRPQGHHIEIFGLCQSCQPGAPSASHLAHSG